MLRKRQGVRAGLWTSGALLAALMVANGCKKAPAPVETPVVPAAPAKAARVPVTAPPAIKKHLYPEVADGAADVAKGIAEAKKEHKRLILDFGGDWCGDCQVLDIYLDQQPNKDLLEKNFVKVNVNIGREDANIDLAAKYGVNPGNGVPALAVVDGQGRTLYSQSKEFRDMRYMESASVTDFLNKWKK